MHIARSRPFRTAFLFGITLLDLEQEGSVRGKNFTHSLKPMKARLILAASLVGLSSLVVITGSPSKTKSDYAQLNPYKTIECRDGYGYGYGYRYNIYGYKCNSGVMFDP